MPTSPAPTNPAPSSDGAARAVLLARPGCHLCDQARAVLRAECAAAGVGWVEIDVDSTLDADGRPLADRYGELVPVVEVDGRRVGYWQIDPARLREALRRGQP